MRDAVDRIAEELRGTHQDAGGEQEHASESVMEAEDVVVRLDFAKPEKVSEGVGEKKFVHGCLCRRYPAGCKRRLILKRDRF